MSAPNFREEVERASVPVRRQSQRRSWLQRHWLTSALVFVMSGAVVWTGASLYEAEQRLHLVRQSRLEMERELQETERRYEMLTAELEQVSSDRNMELQAKRFGFARADERIYQTGPNPQR